MAKKSFLDVLNSELAENFEFNYEINWNKKAFAVEVAFELPVRGLDENGEEVEDVLEDVVLFYHPDKTKFDENDYLAAIPYDDKGLSREFIQYFVGFLNQTAEKGLNQLTEFLESDDAQDFTLDWDSVSFEAGDEQLTESDYYAYPRY
ncbi:MAG: DUF3013 family protein [Streptococcaceae bacterium]|jgi:hypothetical protein|nr:DUF3013 family protein [Streptococcaceae bacterium]